LDEQVSDGEELAMKAKVVEDADVVTYVVVQTAGYALVLPNDRFVNCCWAFHLVRA
jgi:hypothetical protein